MKGNNKKGQYEKQWKNAIDYDVYEMDTKEKITGFLLGALLGYLAVSIFFDTFILSIIASLVAGVFGIKIYCNVLCNNRKRTLTLQFRDMLESLSTSVGTGKNIPEAFLDCLQEMRSQFDENSYIVKELSRIVTGSSNNINIELLISDFAQRSHNQDIQAFSDVFSVAIRKGGNMKDIITDTKEVISDKITMQMEISSIIAGKRNELNIMIILPFIVVMQVNGMTNNTSTSFGNAIIVFIVKLIALCMFVSAYILGQKMMKIDI